MGIHDFVCFIQRNDQCLHSLELIEVTNEHIKRMDQFYDYNQKSDTENLDYNYYIDYDNGCSFSSDEAIIVLVPSTFTKDEIINWNLKKFKEFPFIKAKYDRLDWSFLNIDGYDEILMGDDDHKSVWISPNYPNKYMVNFDPVAYEIFVQSEPSDEIIAKIPYPYLKEAYNNRDLELPKSKVKCYLGLVYPNDHII